MTSSAWRRCRRRCVVLRVHRDRVQAQFAGRPRDADRDLAAVGDEEARDRHVRPPAIRPSGAHYAGEAAIVVSRRRCYTGPSEGADRAIRPCSCCPRDGRRDGPFGAAARHRRGGWARPPPPPHVRQGRAALTLGVSDGAKAAVIAALARDAARRSSSSPRSPSTPTRSPTNCSAWLGAEHAARVLLFPSATPCPTSASRPIPTTSPRASPSSTRSRDAATRADHRRLRRGDRPAHALARRTRARDASRSRAAARVDQHDLLRALDAGGYRIEPQVTQPGEASRRGGIVDVWPPSEDAAAAHRAVRRRRRESSAPSIRRRSARREQRDERAHRRRARARRSTRRACGSSPSRCSRTTSAATQRERIEADIARLRDGEPFDGDRLLRAVPRRTRRCSTTCRQTRWSSSTSRPTSRPCSGSTTSRRTKPAASWSCAASCRTACRSRTSPWPDLRAAIESAAAPAEPLALGGRR